MEKCLNFLETSWATIKDDKYDGLFVKGASSLVIMG